MNIRLKTSCYAVLSTALAFPAMALAADNPFNTAKVLTNDVGNKAGIQTTGTLPGMIGSIINVALGFLGILLLFYMLYAGFLWMTAGGDTKKVDNAQAIIKNSIIGLLIIVAAYAISNFVLGSLINVSTAA